METPLLSHLLVLLGLMQLLAEDADSQPNSQIRFSITSGDRDGEFAVEPVLGLVRVQKKLDRERVCHPGEPLPSPCGPRSGLGSQQAAENCSGPARTQLKHWTDSVRPPHPLSSSKWGPEPP